jgi:hypothetical protein
MDDFDTIPVRLPSGTKAVVRLPRPFTLEDGVHLMDFLSLYIEGKNLPAAGNAETAQPAKAYIAERTAELIRAGCSTVAQMSAVPTEAETVVVHVAPAPGKKE